MSTQLFLFSLSFEVNMNSLKNIFKYWSLYQTARKKKGLSSCILLHVPITTD